MFYSEYDFTVVYDLMWCFQKKHIEHHGITGKRNNNNRNIHDDDDDNGKMTNANTNKTTDQRQYNSDVMSLISIGNNYFTLFTTIELHTYKFIEYTVI